ncbi:MAG: restriction endonuclease [Methylococcaceae bacterium]|nr:restriction endonuclease [Methylococcaceae bacterium]
MPKIANLRLSAFIRQAGRCYYCGYPMWTTDAAAFAKDHGITVKQARRHECTAEHLQPRQNGGQDTPLNIVAACLCCNKSRHLHGANPAPEVYLKVIQKRVKRKGWPGPWVAKMNPVAAYCSA